MAVHDPNGTIRDIRGQEMAKSRGIGRAEKGEEPTYVDLPFMIAFPRSLRMMEPVGLSFNSSSVTSITNDRKSESLELVSTVLVRNITKSTQNR